jgi:hypothetical protein
MTTKNKKFAGIIAGLSLITAVGLGLGASGGATGANFTADGSGSLTATAGTLSFAGGGAQLFSLSYTNLAPGASPQSETITVQNTGSLPAEVSISNLGGASFAPTTPSYVNSLYVSVDSYLPATGVGKISAPIDLGPIAAGETRTFTVRAGLDSSAGNSWQGVTFSDPQVTMHLQQ